MSVPRAVHVDECSPVCLNWCLCPWGESQAHHQHHPSAEILQLRLSSFTSDNKWITRQQMENQTIKIFLVSKHPALVISSGHHSLVRAPVYM